MSATLKAQITRNGNKVVVNRETLLVDGSFNLTALTSFCNEIETNQFFDDLIDEGTRMYCVSVKNPSVGYEVKSWA